MVLCHFAAFIFLVAPADPPEQKKGDRTALAELSMEVTALETLRQFRFTQLQLETMRSLAAETVQPARERKPAAVSEEYRKVLGDLRNALADGKDEEKIAKLREDLSDLQEAEDPELDDTVEMTAAARRRGREIFASVGPRQLVSYLAGFGDDFPDPLEQLLEAIPSVRTLHGDEWKETRDDLAREIALLATGIDPEKARPMTEQVTQLLNRAHALKEREFRKQRPELEKAVRDLLDKVVATDVVRHVVERDLAELLSNPRLVVAIDACLKKQ